MHIALAHVQVLQLSGSVALFFTGICHAHYSYCSVEHRSGSPFAV